MRHSRFIRRELIRLRRQASVFMVCVALSLTALVALGGFKQNVNQALQADARALHAADIIVKSSYPFTQGLSARLRQLAREGRLRSARTWEFYSVVRDKAGAGSLLCGLKVVEPGYPFYGRVLLASGRPFKQTLKPGRVIAEPGVLDRLGLSVGDSVTVGRKSMIIADTVEEEPDRPVSFFSLGPRLFVHADDLTDLGLVSAGSRVRYRALIKILPGTSLDGLAAELRQAASPDQERVETFRTTRSRIKRFSDNFLFFLNLVGIFTLLLAGIGIQSALAAMLRESTDTIAIMKTLGAGHRFILWHFVVLVSLLGAAGTVLGLAAGAGLARMLPGLIGDLLYPHIPSTLPWTVVLEGVGLGIGVVSLFAVLPLIRLRDLKPVWILRKATSTHRRSGLYWLALAMVVLFFVFMILWQIGDTRVGMIFIVAAGVLIALATAATQAALWLIKRWRFNRTTWRQAQRGLFRSGNATAAIIVTLSAAFTVLLTLHLVEANLDASFVKSFPPDAPNLFFINIRPDQKNEVAAILGRRPRFHPIIRARLTAVNGKPVDSDTERRRRGDNLSRVFNLTFRSDLLADERLIDAHRLFDPDSETIQVSVLDTVLEMRPMEIGDQLTFNIQGVPLAARVTSVRTRVRDSLKPFFYFVFPPRVLEKAPHTVFTAIRADPQEINRLQQSVVDRFPNVSVIDVSQTVKRFAAVLARFSTVVRFFTAFSMAAGLLLVISSIFATRQSRIREAVYFKILGARSRFVLSVFTLESLLIGMLSCLVALVFAHAVAGWICAGVFDIQFHPFPAASAGMSLVALATVTAVSLASSISILRHRPMVYLRHQPD